MSAPEENHYSDYTSSVPPLRPPNLTNAQLAAAIQLGFSEKYVPSGGGGGSSNGRRGPGQHQQDPVDSSGFPEISQFSLDDCAPEPPPESGDNTNNGPNERPSNPQQQQGQNDNPQGLLDPLRRPHVNEIPPDVLALLLKSPQFEEILKQLQSQTQTPPQMQTSVPSPPPVTNRNNGFQNQSQQNSSRPKNTQNPNSNNFQLSANAPVFTPSASSPPTPRPTHNHTQQQQQQPVNVMHQQEEADLMQALAQFQLQFQQQPEFPQGQGDGPPSSSFSDDGGNSDHVLSTVTDAITELTATPASFGRCSRTMTEVLKKSCNDVDTLGVVVTLLVEQCISNPNFCYSGARLAQVLVESGIIVNKVTFKALFLTRCQEEFSGCITGMAKDPTIMVRSRGTLMFFGELFMNLRAKTAVAGETKPLNILGLGVMELMQNLVKDPSHENVKSVFQVLKLVGWDLENSTDPKVKSVFEDLMKELSYVCLASSAIKPQTKQLLDAVFSLKNKKWNRQEEPETKVVATSPSGPANNAYNTQKFYELPESEDDDDDDDCILLDDEPEEVQKAYEEFLMSNKKN